MVSRWAVRMSCGHVTIYLTDAGKPLGRASRGMWHCAECRDDYVTVVSAAYEGDEPDTGPRLVSMMLPLGDQPSLSPDSGPEGEASAEMLDRDQALALAKSPRYDDRVEAGRTLALLGGADVAPVLMNLLLDEQDTGVTEVTADVLLERRDVYGASIVFAALHRSDDEHGDELVWRIADAWRRHGVPIPELAAQVLSGDDPDAREGAAEALSWLGLSPDDGT